AGATPVGRRRSASRLRAGSTRAASATRLRPLPRRSSPASDLAGEPRVPGDELPVRALRPPAALAVQIGEDERRHRLPADTLVVRGAERLLDQRLDVVERLVGWAAEQEAGAAELPVLVRDLRRLRRRLHAR